MNGTDFVSSLVARGMIEVAAWGESTPGALLDQPRPNGLHEPLVSGRFPLMLLRPFLPAGLLALASTAACAPPPGIVATTVQIPAAPPAVEAPRSEEPAPPRLPGESTDERAWSWSESEAVALARREHRPLIVDFTADWCGACRELDRKTYTDPRVQAALKRFVRVKVDTTNDEVPAVEAIQRRYRVVGLPTIILLDSTGKESARITEFISADELLTRIGPIK